MYTGNSEKRKFVLDWINHREYEIQTVLPKLNKPDTITILLSIYEAYSYGTQDILEKLVDTPEDLLPISKAVFLDSRQNKLSILKLIEYVLENVDNCKTELDRIPLIDTIVFPFAKKDDSRITDFCNSIYDLDYDYIIAKNLPLLGGKIDAIRIFPIRDFFKIKSGTEQIEWSFELFGAFNSKRWFESVLHNLDKTQINNEGKISFTITDEEFLQHPHIHSRSFAINSQFPFSKPTLNLEHENVKKTLHLGLLDPEHQKAARQELKIQFDEYQKIPNFKQLFEKTFSTNLEHYLQILTEFLFLTYETDTAQVILSPEKLISKLVDKTGWSKQEITSFIEEKTWKKGENMILKPLIFDGKNYQYTHGEVLQSLHSKFQQCYTEIINNNTKGKYFEEECRQIFRDNDYKVLENSVKINKVILPEEMSDFLGFEKNKDDFDVIGIKNDIVFILECKIRKYSLNLRKKTKEVLQNSFIENFYKGKWVSENFTEFCSIVEQQGMTIPKNCRFVVPLFVSNIPPTEIVDFNPISLIELEEIIQKLETPIPVPEFTINFTSKSTENFPSFVINKK